MKSHPSEPENLKAEEQREAEFWDKATAWDIDLSVNETETGVEDTRRFALLGDLQGKRVLDVGCGTGPWSVRLAQRGAQVFAVDISPQSEAVTRKRVACNSMSGSVEARVMSAYQLEFADGFFDLVHGQDIIHHLDATLFGAEVARVLAAEGTAVFAENCANNPLLMFARNRLCGRFGIPRWSSDDEYPLTRAKIAVFSRCFQSTRVEFPAFHFMLYFDAKLFGYRNRAVSWFCGGVDRTIQKIPFLRQYSYRQLLCCKAGK